MLLDVIRLCWAILITADDHRLIEITHLQGDGLAVDY